MVSSQVVALVGQSGSGKSSCVSLLQRLYDCQVCPDWGRGGFRKSRLPSGVLTTIILSKGFYIGVPLIYLRKFPVAVSLWRLLAINLSLVWHRLFTINRLGHELEVKKKITVIAHMVKVMLMAMFPTLSHVCWYPSVLPSRLPIWLLALWLDDDDAGGDTNNDSGGSDACAAYGLTMLMMMVMMMMLNVLMAKTNMIGLAVMLMMTVNERREY